MDTKPAMSPQLIKDAEDALKVCKITLMMQANTVFYTTILFSLKQIITGEIETAATDGRDLLVNPQFFYDLDPQQRIGLVCHEVLHVALDHMHRMGKRDPKLWNIAADHVINLALRKAGYSLPENGLWDSKYEGMTTEEVYAILDKKSDQQKQGMISACAGTWNGNDVSYPQDAKKDPVPKEDVTNIILRATAQAQARGQAPGSMPGEIEIQLQRTINPPLPWNVILQNFLTDIDKSDFSFRRPNRRFLPDFYLPTPYSEALANIAIFVDSSGSVDDYEFNSFINKIYDVQTTMKPKKITVIAFDTKIKNVQELTEDDDPFKKLKFTGRGGTQIGPVHQWIKDNKPTLAIIFTDGQFGQKEPIDKNVPLFWLIHQNPKWKTKYGRVVHYEIAR